MMIYNVTSWAKVKKNVFLLIQRGQFNKYYVFCRAQGTCKLWKTKSFSVSNCWIKRKENQMIMEANKGVAMSSGNKRLCKKVKSVKKLYF